jgi:hypothetical protein
MIFDNLVVIAGDGSVSRCADFRRPERYIDGLTFALHCLQCDAR